jgi:hypothetical protein
MRQKCFTTLRIINFLDGISLTGIQHVILLTIFGIHQSVIDEVGIDNWSDDGGVGARCRLKGVLFEWESLRR